MKLFEVPAYFISLFIINIINVLAKLNGYIILDILLFDSEDGILMKLSNFFFNFNFKLKRIRIEFVLTLV